MAFLDLLVSINEHAEKQALSVSGIMQPEGTSKQARIAEVVDFITKHYAEEMSVEKAARMAGMSAATFSRNFQRITGNKFVEFVNRIRISQACSMLYSTDEQIASICLQWVFRTLPTLIRQFLKMKDMTPKAYRELALAELAPKKGALQ